MLITGLHEACRLMVDKLHDDPQVASSASGSACCAGIDMIRLNRAIVVFLGSGLPKLNICRHPRGSTANAITAYCSAAAASTSAWKTSW